ncbi:MAG: branched-chain amino acid ABC transporter permease [Candidatus Dormibacteraeota bacterium]|uniref:Branched-chain amino acid ABC transporter permease n=1 Tax=Candidatus Amunia macphersoniae TaxID=3127014 RepID=A0A934KRW1_9BACT|nr:branched-chain amino acid ABC transporter permease [Candidatus Dormibacteraeota bacterium]
MHILIQSIGYGLVTASVIAIGAVGLSLQFGVTNFVNFAYGEFLTLGAYIGYFVSTQAHFNVFVGIVAAMAVTGLLAVLLDQVVFEPFIRGRPNLVVLLIVTVALSLILQNLYQIVFTTDFRRYAAPSNTQYSVGDINFTGSQLLIIAIAITAIGALQILLKYTKLGKAMRAMSDSADLAQASGINTRLVTRAVWLISGMFAGIGGVVLAINVYNVQPTLGNSYLFLFFAAVIMGGIGKPWGALISAVVLGIVIEVSGAYINAAYKGGLAFLILILVLLLRPRGLFSSRRRTV